MAVEKSNTTVQGVEILKPRTDSREYRMIVLKNLLQVLLISDPDTDKVWDRYDLNGDIYLFNFGFVYWFVKFDSFLQVCCFNER